MTEENDRLELLAFVTHELKSPLASMIFGLNAMRNGFMGEVNEQQAEVLGRLERNAEYMNELILNYLNLSRIELGQLRIERAPVPLLTQVLEPAMEQVQQQLAVSEMRIELDVPEAAVVRGDVNLLRVVFHNLLSNAVKYGAEGTPIRLSWLPGRDDSHLIVVHNLGAGIAPDEAASLFQRFSRIERSELRLKKGSGLGLYITHQIVTSHGGSISVMAEQGEFADFCVELPAAPPPAPVAISDDEWRER